MQSLVDQHRVTTDPIEVTDWKGTYDLPSGQGFTVTGISLDGDRIDIERDGLLSGSMGGTVSFTDLLGKTRQT